MNIALNINRLALIGLGVTLSSMIRNCQNPKQLNILILCADLTESDKISINDLISREGANPAKLIDFDPIKEFGMLRSLHGDWTSYGRLLLVDYLPNEDSVLYIDADLVVEVDVLTVASFNFNGKELAAVNGGPIRFSLDKAFLVDILKIDENKDVFNAGILMLNLKLWRQNNVKEKCMTLAKKHPNELASVDQTLLNAIYADDFALLPENFNCPWFPGGNKPTTDQKMILHFVGSPKPWDIAGKTFHPGFNVWYSYLDSTWNKLYGSTSIKDIIRLWKIRRSYLKILKSKIVK